MRTVIPDEIWALMEPMVEAAKRYKGGQVPELPDRDFFEALLYVARTGIPWRDLPGEFGLCSAVYNHFRRWGWAPAGEGGGLKRLFEAMTADPRFDDLRRVFIDGTVNRAHKHAAGARRRKKNSARRSRRSGRASAAAGAV